MFSPKYKTVRKSIFRSRANNPIASRICTALREPSDLAIEKADEVASYAEINKKSPHQNNAEKTGFIHFQEIMLFCQNLCPQAQSKSKPNGSGFDLVRRSDEANERRRKKRRRERYEVRDDVELLARFELATSSLPRMRSTD